MKTLTFDVPLTPATNRLARKYSLAHLPNCDALIPTLLTLAHYHVRYHLHGASITVTLDCPKPSAIRDYMLWTTPSLSPSTTNCHTLFHFLISPTYSTFLDLVCHVVYTLSLY